MPTNKGLLGLRLERSGSRGRGLGPESSAPRLAVNLRGLRVNQLPPVMCDSSPRPGAFGVSSLAKRGDSRKTD